MGGSLRRASRSRSRSATSGRWSSRSAAGSARTRPAVATLLDGYGVDEPSASGRGQVLIPWPNRLQDGTYEFDGRSHQLPLTEPEHANAIHGLVRWAAWRVGEREPSRVVMEHVHPPSARLSVHARARHRVRALGGGPVGDDDRHESSGRDACPYGSGQHPYLTVGTPTVDTIELQAPGRAVLVSDERDLPVGSEPVEGTEYDFRAAAADRRDEARQRLHRSRARRRRPRPRRAPRSGRRRGAHALGRRELPLPDALHRRHPLPT